MVNFNHFNIECWIPEDEETDEEEGDKDGEAKEEDEPGVGGGGQGPSQAVLLVLPFCSVRYIECHRAGNDKYIGGMLQDTRKHI